MIQKVASETRARIIRLSNVLNDAPITEPSPDVKSFTMDQALAMRISELTLDYLKMIIPRVQTKEMYDLFYEDQGIDPTKTMTVGALYQLVPCIADITVNTTIIEDNAHYKIYLAELQKAIQFMKGLGHFLKGATAESLKTEAKAEYLTNCIINTALHDVHKAVTKIMYQVYKDLQDCTDSDREVDLKAMAASCSIYMQTIGFSFMSREWYLIPDEARAEYKDIANWGAWSVVDGNGINFSPMYISWYNPLNRRIYDLRCTSQF